MQENKQEKSLIKQNILLYLEKRGVTPYEFYKKSGVTRGVLSQNNGISEDNLTRFLAYAPDVNIEWLITGIGEMTLSNAGDSSGKDKQNISDMQEISQESLTIEATENRQSSVNGNETTSILVEKIAQQAEEIGRLKEQIRQLLTSKAEDAPNALPPDIANVG